MFKTVINLAPYELPDFRELNRFLIFDLDGIGDSIVNTAFYRELRNYVGNEKIIDLYSKRVRSYDIYNFKYINNIHALYSIDINYINTYDILISLKRHANEHISDIFFKSSCKYKYGYPELVGDLDLNKILTHIVYKYYKFHENNVINTLELLTANGVNIDRWDLEYWYDEEIISINKNISKDEYIILNPWGTNVYAEKNISFNALYELIKLLLTNEKYNIIITGLNEENNKNESDLLENIFEQYNNRIFNLVGKTTFNDMAYLVDKSKFVITCNTSVSHLAAAFKKPLVDVYYMPMNFDNLYGANYIKKYEAWNPLNITLHNTNFFDISGKTIYNAFLTLNGLIN